MTEKEETVEVSLKLPKPVYEFYKALAAFRKEDFEDFLTGQIIKNVDGHVDDPPRGFFIKLYGLEDYSSISPNDSY